MATAVPGTHRLPVRLALVAVLALLLVLPLPGHGARAAAATQAADLVLVNGKIVTVDPAFSIQQAVAISNGQILAVGSDAQIQALAGPGTRVVNLNGRTVIPGLHDSHIHAIRGGNTFTRELDWSGVTSLAEGLELIRQWAAQAPPGGWVQVVGGWHEAQFVEKRTPNGADLDAVAPNTPVYVQYFYERAWVNRAALAAAGITRDTPDPPGGRFVRDASGELTGELEGIPAFNAVYLKIPPPSLDEAVANSRLLYRELNRLGLTTIGDVGGGGTDPDTYRAILYLWERDELPLRARIHLQLNPPGGELETLRRYLDETPLGFPLRPLWGDDRLRILGFGENLIWRAWDGDSFTPRPVPIPPEALAQVEQVVREVAARGFRVHIHATKDASARLLLDILERVNRDVPLRRPVLAHIEDATPETLLRLKALGGGWAVQNRLFFRPDAVATWGEANVRRAPPLRTALRLEVPVGGGTDSTRVATPSPFLSLYWMVTGRAIDGTPMRAAEENLSREEALRLYTMGSAWLDFDEERLGSIEPGKLADLVVLSADYLTVPDEELRRLESVLTIVGGRPVYAAAEFAALMPAQP
jgi:predicted amidohydrolase YtcJ